MAQILVPVSDHAAGLWTVTPLWSKVDDNSTANPTGDGQEITSDAVGNGATSSNCDLRLASGNTPAAGTQTLRVRWRGAGASGRTIQGTCELWEGVPGTGTLRGTVTSPNMDAGTGGERQDSVAVTGVTNYGNLYIRTRGTGTGGGPARTLVVELVEFEIPNAAPATRSGTGTSDGVATVTGVGPDTRSGTGTSDGVATITGVGHDGSPQEELVVNGTFTSDTTGWTPVNAELRNALANLEVTGSGGDAYAYQEVGVVSGSTYSFSVDATVGGDTPRVRVGTSAGDGSIYDDFFVRTHTTEFTASTSSVFISLGPSSTLAGSVSYFDNVSLLGEPPVADTSGTGTSDGLATVTGAGASLNIESGTGTSDGLATVTGDGAKLETRGATATVEGLSTVSGMGASLEQTVGASDGLATATGDGGRRLGATGAIDGIAAVSGEGFASKGGDGTIVGLATVQGSGSAIKAGTASSDGLATVSGSGGSVAVRSGTGATDGLATVSGSGSSSGTTGGEGVSSSVSTASGMGNVVKGGEGLVTTVSTVGGLGNELVMGTGAVAGTSIATGNGNALAAGIGTSDGAATVAGIGASEGGFVPATGASEGTSATQGEGNKVSSGTGTSAGATVVSGLSEEIRKPVNYGMGRVGGPNPFGSALDPAMRL